MSKNWLNDFADIDPPVNGGSLDEVVVKPKSSNWLNDFNLEDERRSALKSKESGHQDAMRGMMKSKIGWGNAFGHPAIKRMSQAHPKTGMTPKGIGTHYMAVMGNYAVPLLQDKGNSRLYYF